VATVAVTVGLIMRKMVIGGLGAAGALVLTVAGGVAAVGLAASAQADAGQDQDFYRLLTEPDQDHPMVIWNFPLVRAQGIAACQREDAGETPMQAAYDLDQRYGGPYIFDFANDITSSAETIYCRWHTAPAPAGNWVNTSAPVYPRPVYPPPMWSPSPAYPYNPPQLDYAR
jgi:hypothetical protein